MVGNAAGATGRVDAVDVACRLEFRSGSGTSNDVGGGDASSSVGCVAKFRCCLKVFGFGDCDG